MCEDCGKESPCPTLVFIRECSDGKARCECCFNEYMKGDAS